MAASVPDVIVETSGWLEFWSAVVGGLLGVAGGLLVFWLGTRHANQLAREETSLQAAGDLLTTIASFKEGWGTRAYPRLGQDDGDHATWLELRLAVVILAPRLTDPEVRSHVLSVYLRYQEFTERKYPDGTSDEVRNADRKAKMQAVSNALDRAEPTLRRYLFQAAFRDVRQSWWQRRPFRRQADIEAAI